MTGNVKQALTWVLAQACHICHPWWSPLSFNQGQGCFRDLVTARHSSRVPGASNLSCFWMALAFICLKYVYLMFYLFLRETDYELGRGRERGRHRIGRRLQALSCQHGANAGLKPVNHEIMTWAEVGLLTNWATQAPLKLIFYTWNILNFSPFEFKNFHMAIL